MEINEYNNSIDNILGGIEYSLKNDQKEIKSINKVSESEEIGHYSLDEWILLSLKDRIIGSIIDINIKINIDCEEYETIYMKYQYNGKNKYYQRL